MDALAVTVTFLGPEVQELRAIAKIRGHARYSQMIREQLGFKPNPERKYVFLDELEELESFPQLVKAVTNLANRIDREFYGQKQLNRSMFEVLNRLAPHKAQNPDVYDPASPIMSFIDEEG